MSLLQYNLGEVIGRGGFSTVRLGRLNSQDLKIPQLIAVKSSKASQTDLLLREEFILKKFRGCPHIIQCYGIDYSFEDEDKTCNLLLEYAPGGNLANKLRKQPKHQFDESEVRRYTKFILEGLTCIHEKGYVHRDIKLQNILMVSEESLKIADFGLARRAGEGDVSEVRGTVLNLSPEALSKSEQEPPADVWSLGCMVAEMLSGAPLWQARQDKDVVVVMMMNIAFCEEVPEIPGNISHQGRDFLGKILIKDPEKRWTAKMLLDHPFVFDEWHATPIPSSSKGTLGWNSSYQSPNSYRSLMKNRQPNSRRRMNCQLHRGLSCWQCDEGRIGRFPRAYTS